MREGGGGSGCAGLISAVRGREEVERAGFAGEEQPVIDRHGKLGAVAVTTGKRIPALPNVPTIGESGVPGYDVVLWHGLIGPKDMPRPIVERINADVTKALADKIYSQLATSDAQFTALFPPRGQPAAAPAGLALVGPRYFGYEIDYVPVEERFGAVARA